MTATLHRFPEDNVSTTNVRSPDLDYLTGFRAAMTSLAEQYVGLP
jgi:p-hydroxybenzoate 3-monooxygenase